MPLKNEMIIGADLNAAIGIQKTCKNECKSKTKDTINDLIGLHGDNMTQVQLHQRSLEKVRLLSLKNVL